MQVRAGTVVDRKYELLEPLAEGGMGIVYEARHVLTEQRVALKLLDVGPESPAQARRFKLEVSVAAKVGHAGLVKVFDAGVELETGRFYIAMELLEGENLRRIMDDGKADSSQVIRWLADTLDAMAAAHEQHVVHRDLKPDNLFIERTATGRRLRVLDFGIARDASGPSATTTGVAVGTALYMAPEQATASKVVGPSADIWACGVMLYEMLAKRRPFDGPSAHAVVVEAVTRPHVPIYELRPDIPVAWSGLVDQCLSKDPDARPTAIELRAAMLTLLDSGASVEMAIPLAKPKPSVPDSTDDAFGATEAAPSTLAAHDLEGESITLPTRSPLALWAIGGGLAVALIGLAAWRLASPIEASAEPTVAPVETVQTIEPPAPDVEEPPPLEPESTAPPVPEPVADRRHSRRRVEPIPEVEPQLPEPEPTPSANPTAAAEPAPDPIPVSDPTTTSNSTPTPTPTPRAEPEPEPTPSEGRGVLMGADDFGRQERRRRGR